MLKSLLLQMFMGWDINYYKTIHLIYLSYSHYFNPILCKKPILFTYKAQKKV